MNAEPIEFSADPQRDLHQVVITVNFNSVTMPDRRTTGL